MLDEVIKPPVKQVLCLAQALHSLLSGCSQPGGRFCDRRGNRSRSTKGTLVRRVSGLL